MTLLLLLALSLSSLVQIETTTASFSRHQQTAKHNALYALNEAIGQLQATAGPDQRVTGRGDILAKLSGIDGAKIEFESVANPYYTLVWDVSGAQEQDPGSIPGHNPRLQPAVLISGNSHKGFDLTRSTAYPEGYVTQDTELSETSMEVVTLVGTKKDSPFQVSVPRASLGEADGYYAWWIGDEGIKARMNLNEPVSDAHSSTTWLAPHALGVQMNAALAESKTEDLSRILSYPQLLLLSDVTELFNSTSDLRADLTLYSKSLLTDTRNGGLKKDLTYGLDKANPQPESISDAVFLFERNLGGAPATDSYNFNFSQWGVLRDYYNMRSTDSPFSARAHRVATTSGSESYKMRIHPIIARVQIGFYADYEGDVVRLHYMPAIVLWNPYSVDISFPDLHLIIKQHQGDNHLDVRDIEIEGVEGTKKFTIGSMLFTVAEDTIPAGRAIIYSPADGRHTYIKGNDYGRYPSSSSERNYLHRGWRQGASFVETTDINKGSSENPSLRYKLESNYIYIDLHESDQTGRSLANLYQLITGMPGSKQMGETDSIQPYQPDKEEDYPDPKFLFIFTQPFAETVFYSRTEPARRWASNFNPRAKVNTGNTGGSNEQNFGYEGLDNYVGGFLADADAEANYSLQTVDGTYAFVGTSATFSGADKAILFDIPRAPLQSLAQLTHADLLAPPASNEAEAMKNYGHGGRYLGKAYEALSLSFTSAGDDSAPAYPIGSARANPYLRLKGSGTNETRYWRAFNVGSSASEKLVWDFSYLLNETLFDRYFFSTIPQTGNNTLPVGNPLIQVIDNVPPTPSQLRNFNTAAAHLAVVGGFNVNSTSVEAWSAFLAAMRDNDYASEEGAGSFFPRFFSPPAGALATENIGARAAASLTGHRRLSDQQIRDLSHRIVEQVKLRGPFPSMAAFVNRVMWEQALYRDSNDFKKDAPDPHNIYGNSYSLEEMVMRKGALEAALELSTANDRFFRNNEIITSSSPLKGTSANNRGFWGAIGTDIPGYLSQVDILSLLAPLMTVRSDTFVIRAYGAAINPATGATTAEAWCEAVVQRLPTYIDPIDPPSTEPKTLSETNKKIGRKFHIISIRWLSPDEV